MQIITNEQVAYKMDRKMRFIATIMWARRIRHGVPWNSRLAFPKLRLIHLTVKSGGGHQLRMRALLHKLTAVEHEDAVGEFNGGKTVSNDKRRPILHQPLQGCLEQPLALRVQRRRRLVENEHGGVFSETPAQWKSAASGPPITATRARRPRSRSLPASRGYPRECWLPAPPRRSAPRKPAVDHTGYCSARFPRIGILPGTPTPPAAAASRGPVLSDRIRRKGWRRTWADGMPAAGSPAWSFLRRSVPRGQSPRQALP